MDEFIDILNAEGQFTGQIRLKSEAHRLGLFHSTVHIWLYTKKGEILLQQRHQSKVAFPLKWDVSVAGHIEVGESIEGAAVREIAEEIGYTITSSQLEKISVFREVRQHSSNFIDREFHHVFCCLLSKSLDQLNKQDTEVAALKLLPLAQLKSDLEHGKKSKTYVPFDSKYFDMVYKVLESKGIAD